MASLLGNTMLCHRKISSPSANLSRSQRADTFISLALKYQVLRRPAAGEKIHSQKIYTVMATHPQETVRPLTYTDRHSTWGDTFTSFVYNYRAAEEYAKEIEPLKEEVRAMLLANTKDEQDKIQLIDVLERLGISYHYEKEIDEQLEQIFNLISGFEEKNQYDLYNASLLFRILRKHGFDISLEIFNKFKDSTGKFKEDLTNDAKGLLSLYEASFLRRHGEDILDDALSFTKLQLQGMTSDLSSTLRKQVNHALVQPLHRGYERTEAYYNICFYEEDESKNDKLLKFAKLDFNLLQMLHKQELSNLMRWWKPIIENFDYAKDRMVEAYYIVVGQYFEPQYSLDRIMSAKTMILFTVIDDTFDAYGTLEELQQFRDAVERWNYKEIEGLPDYMKALYEVILNLHQEYEEELRKQGRSYAVDSWQERVKELVKVYYKEATWMMTGCIPNFEEYLELGTATATTYQMMPAFLFRAQSATKETFDWLKNNPKIVFAAAIIFRLLNDIATYEDDKARGQLTNGTECYMEQYNVSKEEVIVKFHKMTEDAWKDINEEVRRTSKIPKIVLRMTLNYTRLVHVFHMNDLNNYVHIEGFIKPQLTSLFVNPLNI